MKVLILSTSDIEGGAARSAYRLHQGLQRLNLTSQMLVQVKSSADLTVLSPPPNFRRDFAKVRYSFDYLPLKMYPKRQGTSFSCQWLPDGVSGRVKEIKPDILNLHWVGAGYLQIETLAQLEQPLVWTLHDMWAFTGGCHYAQMCDRYTQSCGACPQLGSNREWDLSRWIWKRKATAWKNLNLTIVTPSQWLANCVQASSLLKNYRVEIIPYGIDLNIYQPVDRQVARSLLRLPPDKRLVLAGAASFDSDRRKGFFLLQEALRQLPPEWQEKIELVVYGTPRPSAQGNTIDLPIPVHYLGTLKDDLSLVLAYSAVNLFVAPSLQDNLPNTVIEALACGVPCLAFNIGGMPDMIEHQINGYLAQPFEIQDLVRGMVWVVNDLERNRKLAMAARTRAEKCFPLELQAQRYSRLFEELL